MTNDITSERKTHADLGKLLLSIAIAFFIVATVMLFVSKTPYTILIAFLSLLFGLTGFSQLESANKLPLISPVIFELELLGAVLKTGTAFHVLLEITITPDPAPPQALERIRIRLQRTLNIYVTKLEAISDDPFAEFDALFQKDLDSLCKELGLQRITLQTIDVKVEGAPQAPQRGIYLGER